MANVELKTFLEDRLRALDPTIDLDTGSPAQEQFIEPVLAYLGTDPFETDIDKFITDRFSQEFPNVFIDDPGVIRDVFIKPLLVLLEPFKREIQSIKRAQSLQNPELLSNEDADALVANVFDERDPGGFAVGTARLLYINPTNVQVEITNRLFTASGLSFFPTNPVSITAEEMVFNKTGSQYFFDLPVKAEKEGTEYNIDKGQLSGIDGQFGVVKVTNLQKFQNGASVLDTPSFVAAAREALNERSLVTRRGATARLNDVFQTELRAIQVIGAKDPEMERDLLTGTSPGHAWITGKVLIYGSLAFVSAEIIDGDESDAPVAGDTVFLYLDKARFTLPQASRFVRLLVEEVYIGPLTASTPYQTLYLVRFSGAFPAGVTITNGTQFDGGFSKKGTLRIDSLPTLGATNLSATDGAVHVFGHSDFYIRPILQPSSTSIWGKLSDHESLIERLTLRTLGLTLPNRVEDPGAPALDFVTAGVTTNDLLVIETGDDAGTYSIIDVSSSALLLGANLTNSQSGIRYRILRKISVNPFEPIIPKFPFGTLLANDLQTTIGSKLFKLSTNDVVSFGAQIGDTLRVLSGISQGDYTITAFDTVLGGKGPIVDRQAPASVTGATYEVFTPMEKLERPLVRIKEVTLLDSSQQSTGITIPYADPVGARPTSDFTSARVRGSSQRMSGFVLPSFATTSLTTYLAGTDIAAASGDRRYSLNIDTPVGLYKRVTYPDTTLAELDYHANPGAGTGDALDPASYFVATAEGEDEAENFPPADPQPGDALTLKNGPNKGSYLIKSVYKFKHKLSGPARTVWTYFIKIYGQFPVDVFAELFDFLNDVGGGPNSAVTELPINAQAVAFPGYFTTLYGTLGTKLNTALTALNATVPPSPGTLQTAIDQMVLTEYDWGDPARGVLRSYMMSPTVLQQNTGESPSPTLFTYTTPTGEEVKFRPDPFRYVQQEIIPARLASDTDPLSYPRDLDQCITLSYNTQTMDFTVGKTLTGASSGATATIIADVDAGATGTLTLANVVGTFAPPELITDDGLPGSATSQALGTSTIISLKDTTRAPMSILGVTPQDTLAVHEERFMLGTDNSRQLAVQTLSGSTRLYVPFPGSYFSADMVGDMLFLEQGIDSGGYRVVSFIDAQTVDVDKAMTESTPTVLASGAVTGWGHNGVANVINVGADLTAYVGKFVTLVGINYNYQGSYAIASAANPFITITRTGNFPGSPVLHSETTAFYVITNAPVTSPAIAGQGTELVGLRPMRLYEAVAKEVEIASVVNTDLTVSRATVAASPAVRRGLNQPFRIFKADIRRVTPTEMKANAFGPFNFFDTEVVSLTPQSSANLAKESYLTVDEGTYSSLGYKHRVADRTRSYSMEEEGFVDISPRVLPVDVADSLDNYIPLVGSSLLITYEQSDLVRRVQEFASSAQDRVTSANLLVRHFLPAYVSYDAQYLGGSAPSVIATDILDYINNLPVEEPLDVSEVQDMISRRGGNPITPTGVQTLIHDWGRKLWLEYSQNKLGGSETIVPYDGTPRVSFFVPGPDVSGQTPIPTGERIRLERL